MAERLISVVPIMLVYGCQQAAMPVEPLKITGGRSANIAGEVVAAVESKNLQKLAMLAPSPKDIRLPGQEFDVQELAHEGCRWSEAVGRDHRVELIGRCDAPPCATPWKAELEIADEKLVAGAVYWWDC